MTTSVFDLPPTTSNIHHDDDKNNMTSGQVIWEGVVEATSTQPRVIAPKHMRVRKHTYSVYATSVLQAPKDEWPAGHSLQKQKLPQNSRKSMQLLLVLYVSHLQFYNTNMANLPTFR